MPLALGEIMARTGAGSGGYEPRTGRAFGALSPSDIAAAIATIKNKKAVMLIEAKYLDQSADGFDVGLMVVEYRRSCTHCLKRVDTVIKLADAALRFYVDSPRCRRCRGTASEWDRDALRFVTCTNCNGYGRRYASVREVARLSGMSRSKLKPSHIRCFWEMWKILSIWEDIASAQVRKALRK